MVTLRLPTLTFVVFLLVTLVCTVPTAALPSSSSSRSSSSRSSSSSSSSSRNRSSSSSSSNSASQIAARNRARNRSSLSSSSSSSLHKNRNSWANCPATGNTRPIGVGSSSSPVSDGNGSKGWYEYDSCRHTCWFVSAESSKEGSVTTTLTNRYTTPCPSGTFSSEDDRDEGDIEGEASSEFKGVASGLSVTMLVSAATLAVMACI